MTWKHHPPSTRGRSALRERGLTYWADPRHEPENEINHNGRGFYFEDPEGNNMEVLTSSHGA
jgi:hypothetical protein